MDAATVFRWVKEFGPAIRKRAYGQNRSWLGVPWHVEATHLRVIG
ncbi:MAG: hypothetical protein AAFU80_11040 [Pseudomonadota bacterium]